MSYEQLLFYKVTQLEVTGETTFHSTFEFNRLKDAIEKDGRGYSVRECADKPGYCETYKVVIMAWTRYDLWDPWIVKKTNELPERWAVLDCKKRVIVFVDNNAWSAKKYMSTLHGNYKVMQYFGNRPNGIQ